jgi:tetratricopeptide (TPR) repeat protein
VALIPRNVLARAVRNHEGAIASHAAWRLGEAERSCRRALVLYAAAEGSRHPDVANALVELGQILEARDRLVEARRCQRQALAILGAAMERPPVDPDLGRLRIRARVFLAGIERALGNYAAADRGYQKAFEEARRELGARDLELARLFNNWGMLRKYQGRFDEAVRFYRRALRMVRAWNDPDALATLHHNLGGIEHARGRFAAGERHARRSVALREAVLGPRHVLVAADVAALAALVDGAGRIEEAATLYQRALAVFRRKLGSGSFEVGINLSSLAALRQKQGRLALAERLYRQSLAILERVLGRRHPDVALTLNNWGHLVREIGDLARAERLYARALRIFERSLGGRHPNSRHCRANHRAVRKQRGQRLRAGTRARGRRRISRFAANAE